MSQTVFWFMHKSYELYEYYILDGMISQAYNKLWNEGERFYLRAAKPLSNKNRSNCETRKLCEFCIQSIQFKDIFFELYAKLTQFKSFAIADWQTRNGEIIMTQVLEAAMLICFGFSWPMNVYKNFKAKTAKSMSLPFILLIISGYVAGICAKLYSHNVSYVLVVYVLNLLIVLVNVVVYFINRRYDKRKANERKVCL